jgi:tubulin polyglutamylase TTLL1
LRLWIESTRGVEACDTLFSNMNRLIVHSLLACQDVIVNDRHCFECYGYDLLIDDDLKVWGMWSVGWLVGW